MVAKNRWVFAFHLSTTTVGRVGREAFVATTSDAGNLIQLIIYKLQVTTFTSHPKNKK